MAKPKIPNQRKANLEHKKRIEQYCALIQQIYDNITKKGAQLALLTNHEPGEPFSFDDYPMAKGAFSKLMDRMKSDLTATIMAGTSKEWKQSNIVQDMVANKVLTAYTGTSKNKDLFPRYYQTNPDSLKAFQQRKIAGMNLSTRVWNLSEQFKPELEMAISSAIAPGTSAQLLSQQVKQYLNEPDLMFRRFRYKDENGQWKKKWKKRYIDENGNVKFEDCDKDSYSNKWTGPGYYKSSSKNAMRLTRTEINMAYRIAEQERWKQFDFVVGYEVKTTQNGTHDSNPKEENYKYRPARLANLRAIHKPDMCDMLAGKYPKDFNFTGWHPQCLCYAIPILKTEDEFWNYDEEDPEESVNAVTDVPEQFKDWVKENSGRITKAEKEGKSLPYFLLDNKDYMIEALRKNNYERERIKTKLDEINAPREQKLFVSFEPFSPILLEKLDKIRDKKYKLKLFDELLNDDVFKTNYLIENGTKTVIHPLHKTKDKFWGQTLKMAKELNQLGKNVIFLPEYENKISADALIIFNGLPRVVDFKYSTSTKYDTLQKHLVEGFRQTNAVVLKLENMDSGQFKNTIEYMKRNSLPIGDILLLNKHGQGIELSYRDLKFGKYHNKIKGFLK